MTKPRNTPTFDRADLVVEHLRQLLVDLRADTERGTEALARRVAGLEADAQDLQQLLQASERQAAQLANLYVATFQLHASLELDDVKRAICEIAINLLGAQSLALLVRDEDSGAIDVVARSEEVPELFLAERYGGGDPAIDAGLVDGVIRLGPIEDSSALVVVPLSAQGQVLGTLVIFALLPQKSGLGAEDRELLDLMAAHAASALLAAKIFQERTRKLRTLEGLMDLLKGSTGGGVGR